jgi:hypothetical protein
MTPRRSLAIVAALAARAARAAVVGLAGLAGACSSTTGLPPATLTNVVDTVSLYALRGTPINLPSAYSVQGRTSVRIDQTVALDFAFDYDSVGEPAFFTTGALRLGTGSGLQQASTAFDAITSAPTTGYITDRPIAITPGSVLLVASRPLTCVYGTTVSLYAKLRVLTVDAMAKRVDFAILVNQNCGYHDLQPGLPSH